MAENAKPGPESRPSAPASDAGHVPITEEFDRAKWTLPPLVPILIAVAAVAIVVAIVVLTNKPEPVATASIVKVASADQSGNSMVAVQVRVDNKIPKQLWIKNLSSELETADGKKYNDTAAPALDASRYLEVFPPLKDAGGEPMREEAKIPAGQSYTGFLVFAFPVEKAAFDGRKSLIVKIGFYDQPTLIARQ
jgi:hypothetical protein